MLIEQVMKPVHEFLADTLLATPDVTKHADVKRLWAAMLKITFGIYVLFVTAGGITVMGYETVQTRYALKQILPRLLLGAVAATTSLTVMGKAIGLAPTPSPTRSWLRTWRITGKAWSNGSCRSRCSASRD
ncbi:MULTISPECIES: hypothetical protein [unclassified Streptomyces]|uniref:hypothetical protein n=1 Tax=unclassified Streptomyces TaxID=2593676 RepID=UPI000A81792A|nr:MULTISPECIES: hypothetical protein [unclassified Streptomyces]